MRDEQARVARADFNVKLHLSFGNHHEGSPGRPSWRLDPRPMMVPRYFAAAEGTQGCTPTTIQLFFFAFNTAVLFL